MENKRLKNLDQETFEKYLALVELRAKENGPSSRWAPLFYDAWNEKAMRTPTNSFDGAPLPTEEEVVIIRCVHEGTCPVCGRQANSFSYREVETLSPFGAPEEMTITCREGHSATAEPNENGSDFGGWIN